MFSLLVIAALVAVTTASPAPLAAPVFPSGRIIGGENALIETYPYQVSLEVYGFHSCGGSIISSKVVITAGHCVTWGASALTVRAGSSLIDEGGSVHQVAKIVRHEKYATNSYGVPLNDVAVLILKNAIVFDDTKQPIKLYEKNEESAPGAMAVITGWGNTDTGTPDQLQTVAVPIVTKQLCDKAYSREYGGLPAGQICAAYYGVGGKDSCQGDSGGPLAIDGRLAGIVSWGNGCAQPYYPGVYTEVAAFRDWIKEHAQV